MEKPVWSSRQVGNPLIARVFHGFRFFSFVGVSIGAILGAPLKAQNLCNASAPNYPCLNQPNEKDDTITGQLVAQGQAVPDGGRVRLSVTGFEPKTGPDSIDAASGKFQFKLPGSLGAANVVRVDIAGDGTTGDIRVQPAQPNGKICGKTANAADTPCLNQPYDGDTELKGTLTPEGKAVDVLVDSKKQPDVAFTLAKSDFTITGLARLSTYDNVEIVQTMPPMPAGQKQPTTGEVAVKATNKYFNLGLSIPAASESLDFGHQAMETESATKQVTITNPTANPVDLVDPSTTITSTNFRIAANSCASTLQPKASCSFNVSFAPFSSARIPGRADTDFIVIVAKYDQAANKKFRDLVGQLQTARGHRGKYEQAVYTINTEVNKDIINLAVNQINQVFHEKKKVEIEPVKSNQEALQNRNSNIAAASLAINYAEEDENAAIRELELNFQVISLSGSPDHWKYPLTRAVVGVDLSAPAAQSIKQGYFLEFDLLAPLTLPGLSKYKNRDPLENRLWLWFNPRITTLPQGANFSALSTINETGSFFNNESSKGTLGDIQGLDVVGGIDIAIVKPRDGIPWWGEYTNTQARLAPSFIIGGGMSTPFSTSNTDIFSQANQGICDAFSLINPNLPPPTAPPIVSTPRGLICGNTGPTGSPANQTYIVAPNPTSTNPTGTKNDPFVDFFTPERSRFFQKAYAGFRLKTYFFSKAVKGDCMPKPSRLEEMGDCEGLYDIFPGIVDVTFGKDEAVTGGKLSSWLFRLDAVYPLPGYPGIHLFASVYTALQSNNFTQPYNPYTILTPATGTNNDFNTFRFGIQPVNRDYFRIGVGVDLFQLFKKNGGQPSATAPAPKPSTTTNTPPS